MAPRPEQKSSTSSAPPPAPPLADPTDRTATPDGLDVGAVKAAVAKVEHERRLKIELRHNHMSDCPAQRSGECSCPANLASMPAPLEAQELENGVTFVRVDEGIRRTVKKQDPTTTANIRLIDFEVFDPPRWVCTSCGFAMRATSVLGHVCEPGALAFKAKPLPASFALPPEERMGGVFRLTIWRDAEGNYHLGDIVIRDRKVVTDREIMVEGDFNALEGALNDRVVEEFVL